MYWPQISSQSWFSPLKWIFFLIVLDLWIWLLDYSIGRCFILPIYLLLFETSNLSLNHQNWPWVEIPVKNCLKWPKYVSIPSILFTNWCLGIDTQQFVHEEGLWISIPPFLCIDTLVFQIQKCPFWFPVDLFGFVLNIVISYTSLWVETLLLSLPWYDWWYIMVSQRTFDTWNPMVSNKARYLNEKETFVNWTCEEHLMTLKW